MSDFKYDIVIFDLDGTLSDTIESLTYVCNRVATKYSFRQYSHDEVRARVGYGLRNLLLAILPEELKKDGDFIEEAFAYMNRIFLANPCYKVNLYKGIAELLDALKSNDIKMAISTNKIQKGADEIALKLLGNWSFTHVIGDDLKHPKKPDPYSVNVILDDLKIPKSRALYVGDSEADIKTAKNAGIDVAAVTWGFRDAEILRKSGPKYMIDSPMQLCTVLSI